MNSRIRLLPSQKKPAGRRAAVARRDGAGTLQTNVASGAAGTLTTKLGGKTATRRAGSDARGLDEGLLTEAELAAIERQYGDGLTAVQIIDVFAERGLRFSEATFRKYVQQGLLPRSRRVGRKGKHRGSLGVYPAKTIRRINAVKQLMGEGLTIEEIGAKFAQSTDTLEGLQEAIDGALEALSSQLTGLTGSAARDMKRQLGQAQEAAAQLVASVEALAAQLGRLGQKPTLRRSGVFGSEELL